MSVEFFIPIVNAKKGLAGADGPSISPSFWSRSTGCSTGWVFWHRDSSGGLEGNSNVFYLRCRNPSPFH